MITLECVTKELFLMNWEVLEFRRKLSYAQRLNARLRGKDPMLADMRALVALIRAKGSDFTDLYEENRRNIVDVLSNVSTTSRDYWWQDTGKEDGPTPFMIGLGPSTILAHLIHQLVEGGQ
jgi:hypothetical protein